MKNTSQDMTTPGFGQVVIDSTGHANVSLHQIGNQYTRITVVTAGVKGMLLADWMKQHAGFVTSLFDKERALLFRGFEPTDNEGMAAIVRESSEGGALNYVEPSTPRTRKGNAIYTSTEYPKEQRIPQHNEHAYSDFWPKKLYFYCVQPSETGGQTPVCDSAEVFKRIPAAVRDLFGSKGGIMYVRNFSDEIDISWKEFFGTDNRNEVETYCQKRKMNFAWLEDNRLRISQQAQVTITDSHSGSKIWFNQAHLFHYSNLDKEVAHYLVETYGKDNLPRNAFFADGSEINAADLDAVREAYDQVMFKFDWESGDLLMIDNLAYTHGRESYTGSRNLLVAMSEEDGIHNYPDSAPVYSATKHTTENTDRMATEDVVSHSRQNTSRHFFLKESRFNNSKAMLKYKLAVSCRMLRMLELDEGSISGHISLKVPGSENLFWVNPFGVLFDEVTPDNLVMVDENGIVVDGDHPVNVAGFCIHSSIHQSNKDIGCIVHTHSPWGYVVFCFGRLHHTSHRSEQLYVLR
ncbi:TauD/TfdA family dioxygenase [Chitinophaga sp. OAE865]|uniref:TauD/TfdA family dioxygenase n=1 Tax=Chitinophaga sp. OAE865 TaxID=2817898 RepID=UPI0033996CC2